MSTLKYHDGTGWVELPAVSPRGPAGQDGATGPTGTAGGTVDTSNLVLNAGDTMTGALTLPADPVVPMATATKQYVDAGGEPKSSMYGSVLPVPVPSGVDVELTPVATAISGLTIDGNRIRLNRTGYYLAYIYFAWDIPANTLRNLCSILVYRGGGATGTVIGRRNIGSSEVHHSVSAAVFANPGDELLFTVHQIMGAGYSVAAGSRLAVRFLGENH